MKKRFMILVILSICFILALIGCGDQNSEDMVEDTIGELMDAENEALKEEAQAHRTYSNDDESVKIISSKQPKEIPEEFIEFDYGTHLQTVLHLEEEGNWTIIYTATMAEIESYEKDITKAGWVNDDSFNDSPNVLSYDLDGLNTFIHIGDEVQAENNTNYISIYLDLGDDMKKDQEVGEEEFVVEANDESHTFAAKIPDDYPEDICPIYQPSKVSMGLKSEDDEFIGYTVGLLTVDEVEKVKNFYSALNPQSSSDMGMMAVYVFEYENGIDYASITVMENQDEADKEFETSITISISLSK